MIILGISASYHDSAAAIIRDGHIVAAAQEERFTRKKYDASFPVNAVRFVVDELGIHPEEIDHVAFYDKPLLKFERLLETYLAFAPRGFTSFTKSMPLWLREKLFQKPLLVKALRECLAPQVDWSRKLLFAEHHQSHAASAFFPSPFAEALVLTMDGVGEWATAALSIGRGRELQPVKEIHFPHSLGLLYSAFTAYAGFTVNSGEYKLMGLAPYGEPRFRALILERLIDVKPDGSFRLNMDYFNYATGLTMTNAKFHALFGAQPRAPEEPVTPFHCDIAASIQSVLEEVVLKLTRALAEEYRIPNLCLAGGVALNCVTNGKVWDEGRFQSVWIQPAAGDAGGAIGAALAAYHGHFGQPRVKHEGSDGLQGSYLGPAFSQANIERVLTAAGAVFMTLPEEALLDRVADALAKGKTVGWFQGRMEFGPRALGNRSILADPRPAGMQKVLNMKIKFRESFRPFAPSVLRERAADWFELKGESPYMLLVAPVHEHHRRQLTPSEQAVTGTDQRNIARSDIPAVTHVDSSARIQTVDAATNPLYHALLSSFEKKTGCPVLVNTSFNVRGEPIVCTPQDALRCFMGTDLDLLAIGHALLLKEEQPAGLKQDHRQQFVGKD